ncbi:RNA 2',3'-cyclic phosphodiesterase [Bacillus marinisedimentorum]|uniref:RNA 2',3'-cyclic phosphodiesterase n=1 Tax=Bacillus marinisedimentorum TaxID=1821260 RepID=UPI0008725960|nr:RNA 2',3'-cyclic phosphodiesterase [Bacillus marinisedimentorum]
MADAHYFIAVPVTEPARSVIKDWAAMLQKRYSFKKWVHPQDYHITLAFLGSAEFSRMERLKNALAPVLDGQEPFRLQINEMGTFGRKDSPRILWAGTEKSEQLERLRDSVYDVCREHGFILDERPFNPHITIARKWVGDESFSHVSDQAPAPKEGKIIEDVEHAVLYQTHMRRTPMYQPLKIFQLGGEQ